MDAYNRYRNAITNLQTLLQQIQTMNPEFTLPLPRFNPIRVSPLEWFIINIIDDRFDWDPVIFQFDNFSDALLERLNALSAAPNGQPFVLIDDIVASYNQTRQAPSTLPFNFFASSDSINLFELEIQERRSRARTRSDIRNLPADMAHTRSRSRSGSF